MYKIKSISGICRIDEKNSKGLPTNINSKAEGNMLSNKYPPPVSESDKAYR